MRKRRLSAVVAMGVMLAMMLAMAAPVLADATVGNLFAGTIAGGAAAAGSENLTEIEPPPNLPIGSDAAFAGYPAAGPVAGGFNLSFQENGAFSGMGDTGAFAGSAFLEGNVVDVGVGNLTVTHED